MKECSVTAGGRKASRERIKGRAGGGRGESLAERNPTSAFFDLGYMAAANVGSPVSGQTVDGVPLPTQEPMTSGTDQWLMETKAVF